MRNDSLSLASVYNGMAIYTYFYTYDLANAINYYYHGLECAKGAGDDRMYYQLLNNMANAYLEQGDTTGIRYARECLEYAKKIDDSWLKFSSSLCIADMYYTIHDYTRAFRFLSEAETAIPNIQGHNLGEFFRLKARVQEKVGMYDAAATNFELAKQEWRSTPSRYLNLLVDQAAFETDRGNLTHSRQLLDSVLEISSDSINNKARLAALWYYSYICEKEGNYKEALNLSRDFSALKSSMYNMNSARMLSEAKAHYDFDRLSGLLAQHKIDSMRHRNNFYISMGVVALMIVIMCMVFMYLKRVKKMHRTIVTNMQNVIVAEDALKARIRELESSVTSERPDSQANTDTMQ